MNFMNMVWLVAQKEIKTMLHNKGLLFAGFYVGAMFGVLNLLLGGIASLDLFFYEKSERK